MEAKTGITTFSKNLKTQNVPQKAKKKLNLSKKNKLKKIK